MRFFIQSSISKNLYLLVLLAILPALVILLYSGIEQRQRSIEVGKKNTVLLVNTMAEVQRDISHSAKQMLTTLSLIPEIQSLNPQISGEIFGEVLKQDPKYLNIALTDLEGNVLASGKALKTSKFGDRKHVRGVLENRKFSIGEYIISRVESGAPAFAYASPVFDHDKKLKAVLTTAIKLENLSKFHDISKLPDKSFVAFTDHKGIRLFYYPPQKDTNPIGKPINAKNWEKARNAITPGYFIGRGSDGTRRLIAFEQIRINPGDAPYLYVWAGIPEDVVLASANAALTRNLLLLLFAAILAIIISWLIGEKYFIAPIRQLVFLTQNFAKGNLKARSESIAAANELVDLSQAFNKMASDLESNQKSLRDNEKRFRLLMDSIDSLIYVADMETYEVLFINKFGKNIFGDITGQICWQSLHKDQTEPCSFCTNEYLLTEDGEPGDIYSWEFKNTKTNRYYFIQDRAIQWTDGRIVRLEIAVDITEKKISEREVLKIKKLESVGVLAGGIAHDFNNILSAILGNINLALYDESLPKDTRELLSDAEKASLRAKDLTQQLLTFSRGGFPVKKTASLDKVIQESANFILHGDKVICSFDIPEDLWLVDIDRGQFSQVIQNIVLNASHAMPEGGVITISCENLTSIDRKIMPNAKEERFVRISIHDTGLGIPQHVVEKIFDPYFTTKQEGSGLGLAISQSIINKHGGNISVISSPEDGTTFKIFLPASEQTITQEKEFITESTSSSPGTIMIMDDEKMVRNVGQKMLSKLGYDVVFATDGEEAVQKYKSSMGSDKPIDLVIMDLTIPGGMGGEIAVQETLKIDPKAKVIVASGYSNDPIMADYKKYGFCSAISKPFMLQELSQAISQHLQQ